jgi:hypothetical protein
MHLTLPDDIWPKVEHDRRHPDGRIFSILPPPRGIYVASWLRQFVRSHHDLPIFWPSDRWYRDNHELYPANQHAYLPTRPMTRLQVGLGPHALRLLQARAGADGEAVAGILRRLLVQHFGRRPGDPVRVTGGPHRTTPGQGPNCPTCWV